MDKLIGSKINRHEILEQIGQGGMAKVYKALDQNLKRFVAVKLIRQEAFGIEVIARLQKRFEREAHALARLDHPNIIKVFDYGEYNGMPYLVMDYLPGTTLKEIQKPISTHEAINFLLPVAEALAHAHNKGILHRDVKPSNILITESGKPMLADFGIAKILELNNEEGTLTGTGVGIGTPEYMAPEQGLGNPADKRTDIYSLGIVLFELLTGSKPYTADTPLAVLYKQMNDPLPDFRKITSTNVNGVAYILTKCLAKNPENRFNSMQELISEFKKYLSDDEYKKEYHYNLDIASNDYSQENNELTIDRLFIDPQEKASSKRNYLLFGIVAILGIAIIGIVFFLKNKTASQYPQAIENTAISQNTGELSAIPHEATSVPTTTIEPSITPIPTQISISSLAPITIDNISQLQKIKSLGRGSISKIALDKSEKYLYVWADQFYIYELDSFTEIDPGVLFPNNRIIEYFSQNDTAIINIDGDLCLWSKSKKEVLTTLEIPEELSIYQWKISTDGNYVYGISIDQLTSWNIESHIMQSYPYPENVEFNLLSSTIGFDSENNMMIAYITQQNYDYATTRITVQNIQSQENICYISPQSNISSVRISPDGTKITARTSGKIWLWELDTCTRVGYQEIPVSDNFSGFVEFSEDSMNIFADGINGSLYVLSSKSNLPIQHKYTDIGSGIKHSSNSLVIDSDKYTFIIGKNENVYSISKETDEIMQFESDFYPYPKKISIKNDNSRILLLAESNDSVDSIYSIDTSTDKIVDITSVNSTIQDIDISPDDNLIATAGKDGIIRIFLIEGLRQVGELQGHNSPVTAVVFSPDGNYLASGGGNGVLILWDIKTGKMIKEMQDNIGGYSSITDIEFSPDGAMIGSLAYSYLQFWDANSKQLLRSIKTDYGIQTFFSSGDLFVVDNFEYPFTYTTKFSIVDIKTGEVTKEYSDLPTSGWGQTLTLSSDEQIFSYGGYLYTTGGEVVQLDDLQFSNLLFSNDGSVLIDKTSPLQLYGIPK